MPGPQLHTAPWVVPVAGPVLVDGGVLVEQGRILAVDALPALMQRFPAAEVVPHPQTALTPALINAHIHLELSHLAELASKPLATTFTGWIVRLLSLRDSLGATGAHVEEAAKQTADDQYRQGVSVLADIGNTGLGQQWAANFSGQLLAHREYLGLAAFTLEKNLQRLEAEPRVNRCSGHAPYSTHPQLIRALKQRARALDHVFPLHVAEPAAEGEMLGQGRGEMVDFVRTRGFWDGSFDPPGVRGSIHYLYGLGILDDRTLCVHAVHVEPEEIRILVGEGSKICLCPGSNRFLRVGIAPVERYLDAGLLPALGTDSAASNPELSLWREMALVAKEHPYVDPGAIFSMATRGGAEALGLDDQLGTLSPGKTADLLAVPIPASVHSTDQLMRHLVTAGTTVQPERVFC
ncbi:amidohydrolase family protein [Desulfobulbus propionicus]